MKIRPAGSFFSIDEAMRRVREVRTRQELEGVLREWCGDVFDLSTLQCRYYCEDRRIGWHTYLLTADYADGQYRQQAVAFADLPLEELCDAG